MSIGEQIKVTYCIRDDDVQPVQLLDGALNQSHTILRKAGILF